MSDDPRFPNAGCCIVCGWLRGIVALTTTSGEKPPDNIVVKVLCPQCGAVHTNNMINETQSVASLQAHVAARQG
jgi:hypothetical protein